MQLFEFFDKYLKKKKMFKIKTRENVAGDFFFFVMKMVFWQNNKVLKQHDTKLDLEEKLDLNTSLKSEIWQLKNYFGVSFYYTELSNYVLAHLFIWPFQIDFIWPRFVFDSCRHFVFKKYLKVFVMTSIYVSKQMFKIIQSEFSGSNNDK